MGIAEKQIKGAEELLKQYNLFLETKLLKKELLDKALAEFMVEVSTSAKRIEHMKAVNAMRNANMRTASMRNRSGRRW